ncbi:DUF2911 domain-containing protein [Flavobacteriaceae bacterium LMO-SS05]
MIQNHLSKLLLLLILSLHSVAFAQLDTPRGSQSATVSQRVGITDISITYSRPSVNDRVIWGKLVPFGMNNLGFGTAAESPWRAGANENTTINFTNDVTIEGQALKAGIYGLHMIIYENGKATIIFSKNSTAWGSFFYEPSEDALRVDVQTNSIPFTELLTYDFINVDATSAKVVLNWEKKQIPFKIEVDVSPIVLANMRKDLEGQKGFQRQNWEQAANYALNNGGDLNEALGWIDNAIAGQFYSQKTFSNVFTKAQIMNKMGNNQAYATLMDEAATMANANQLNNLGYQMLGSKDYERALTYFQKAVKLDPTNPNVYDSLGECYKTMGDKKNAIKYLKKSLSMNPPPAVKANSEKLLAELGVM